MTELTQLIARLKRGMARQASYVRTIRHPNLLIASLQELNDLIGNDKVKDAVATQVSHLIMIKRRSLENTKIKEDDVMLNAVLYGPPGVGKTLIGVKLAKIWYSLGYLDGSRNSKEKKQELKDLLKDLFKDNGMGGSSTDDNTLTLYIFFIFVIIFITLLSMTWSFYSKFGGQWTILAICLLIVVILIFGYYISANMNNTNNTKNGKDSKGKNFTGDNCSTKNEEGNCSGIQSHTATPDLSHIPSDDDIIKVVSRADFVDRYVGWTSPKTLKLLEENLGKVLFVDEAYSLINGPHDEFGMEALTTLNLFLSQRSKEIIVIFGGYKDLLESGPYAVQPGLKRRFMWQFECNGYTAQQLFDIFKMQLNKKGWEVSNDSDCLKLFIDNIDAFPAFGGDTERAGFFAELEHSREFIGSETGMKLNRLEARHIQKGIDKLRENSFTESGDESTNPLANMMKLMSGHKKKDNKPTPRSPVPIYNDENAISDIEDVNQDDLNMINAIRERSSQVITH